MSAVDRVLNWMRSRVGDGQVLKRSGNSFVGVDPGTESSSSVPDTTDAYDLGETSTPLRWRYANLSRGVVVTHAATASGIRTGLTVTGAADLLRTASTPQPDVLINGTRTVQWATGALTYQSMVEIRAQTISAAGATVVTDAATVDLDDAPTAGTNVTITNPWALRVRAGAVRFGGALNVDGAVTLGTSATFAKEVNHTISVAASTTTDVAGGALTIKSGDGAAADGNGGELTIDCGAKSGAGMNAALTIGGTNAETVVIGRTGKQVAFPGEIAAVGRFGCNNVTPPAQAAHIVTVATSGATALDGADTVDKAALLALVQELQAKFEALRVSVENTGINAAS